MTKGASTHRVLDLLDKGLVVREPDDPVLRPMNRSFAAGGPALLPTGINLYQHFRQLADRWEAGGAG